MNLFKIAWKSIQHRGFGSWLTILSMALGVMMVVCVLSIHGLVSRSFKSNNSFGYNMLVGARGGAMQLTMNALYYLSQPVENIPYEYYLAFENVQSRQEELKKSIAWNAMLQAQAVREFSLNSGFGGTDLLAGLTQHLTEHAISRQQIASMEYEELGLFSRYTDVAIPLCLGDFYVDPEIGEAYRCVGTNSDFFNKLVLDVDTEEKFEFAQGRAFEYFNQENGFNECVIGSIVARRCGLKLGDVIRPTHGDPSSASAHVHDNPFTIVGILKPTETPNDRALFLNIEGFYLMDGHTKPLSEESVLKTRRDDDADSDDATAAPTSDDFEGEPDLFSDEAEEANQADQATPGNETSETPTPPSDGAPTTEAQPEPASNIKQKNSADESDKNEVAADEIAAETATVVERNRVMPTPLPIEQREVTAVLVRTAQKDDLFSMTSYFLTAQINNEDDLETCLVWSPFRPERAQKSSQAVSPVEQVTALFQIFVDPVRWLLLALTCMICVVSALSILVGIYNSMNQRQHEIAVMRALGASRSKVMAIMLSEAMLLALVGGLLGWVGGHALNAVLGPMVESQTGVSIGFFDFAPGIALDETPLAEYLPSFIQTISFSSEFLIIPGLMLLAVIVGIYPAISAYKTDVSRALAK